MCRSDQCSSRNNQSVSHVMRLAVGPKAVNNPSRRTTPSRPTFRIRLSMTATNPGYDAFTQFPMLGLSSLGPGLDGSVRRLRDLSARIQLRLLARLQLPPVLCGTVCGRIFNVRFTLTFGRFGASTTSRSVPSTWVAGFLRRDTFAEFFSAPYACAPDLNWALCLTGRSARRRSPLITWLGA